KTRAGSAGSFATAASSFDAREKVGGRTRGQSQALPGRAALHRWVSACRFLFARAGKNSPGEEISPQGAGRAPARANLLLQHGLLRRASGQPEIGPGPPAYQLQNGSILPRDREEEPRSRIG